MFGTQTFVADFLNFLHWTLSIATLNSQPRTPFLLDITYFNVTLSSMLSTCHKYNLPYRFSTQRLVTRLLHLSRFLYPKNIWCHSDYKVSLLCSFLAPLALVIVFYFMKISVEILEAA